VKYIHKVLPAKAPPKVDLESSAPVPSEEISNGGSINSLRQNLDDEQTLDESLLQEGDEEKKPVEEVKKGRLNAKRAGLALLNSIKRKSKAIRKRTTKSLAGSKNKY